MTFRMGSPSPRCPGRSTDYNQIMQDNLHRVFGERNAGRRLEAVRELYVPDAIWSWEQTSSSGVAHGFDPFLYSSTRPL
jgi:hypothetical protein